MTDLTKPTPVPALDKFRAEAVDCIVWCIRNNATVKFHEDKTVSVTFDSGDTLTECHRSTFADAVKLAQEQLAEDALALADEAVRS